MSETINFGPQGPKMFQYKARSYTTGKIQTAKMLAPSSAAVAARLKADGWVAIAIEPAKEGALNTDIKDIFGERPLKFDHREIADFASQLHQLLKAGVSVGKALQALGEEAEPKRAQMCNDIADRVNNGMPLSRAMNQYPKVFDEIFCAYIEAGETSGTLVSTTERLAIMLDRRSKLALKIKSVTAYPKLVSIAIGLIVVGIMLFMVPMYANIYDSFGAQLPAPTQMLVNISNNMLPVSFGFQGSFPFVHNFAFHPFSPILWGALIFIGVKVFLKKTQDNPEVGTKLDKIKFRLPIFGRLILCNALFRWSSTLAGGIDSGVSLSSALELSANTSGSRWIKAVLPELQESVRSGKPLSVALNEHKDLFPPNLRAMVATGESSGDLPTMLDSVSSSIDAEIDSIVAGLSAKIEVALLLVMGVVVGALLAVLYLPILQLATTVGSGLSGGEF